MYIVLAMFLASFVTTAELPPYTVPQEQLRSRFIPDLYCEETLSPTGSALARADLSPLTNGIWEIHAGCSCFLHLQLLAKIG